MPYCDACAHHWTPTSMREDGSCPTCGQVLEVRKLPRPASAAAGPPDDGSAGGPDDPDPKAPWHFKVLLGALAIYLSWRAFQGVGWLAAHL